MSVQKIPPLSLHSHIKGLGVDQNFDPIQNAAVNSIVGLENARKVLGGIVKLIKTKGDYPTRGNYYYPLQKLLSKLC